MSLDSPGGSPASWVASLPAQGLPLKGSGRNGACVILAAFVPIGDRALRLKSPWLIQEQIKAIISHHLKISEVGPFSRRGILCSSSDVQCVSDWIQCRFLASLPVRPLTLEQLICIKGITPGLNPSDFPREIQLRNVGVGIITVSRCSRYDDGSRVPAEPVMATFARASCLSELKL